MRRVPLFNLGNLLVNANYADILNQSGSLYPKHWVPHETAYQPVLATDTDGSYMCPSSYNDTATSSSFFVCLPVAPNTAYTAYANIKSPTAGWYGRLLMHVYDGHHNPNIQNNQPFQQDFNLPLDQWTDCIYTFTTPSWAQFLHFSPRSTDSTVVDIKDCRLGVGILNLSQLKNLVPIIPINSQLQHATTMVGQQIWTNGPADMA